VIVGETLLIQLQIHEPAFALSYHLACVVRYEVWGLPLSAVPWAQAKRADLGPAVPNVAPNG